MTTPNAPVHNRKLTEALLDLGGTQFEGQLDDYTLDNGTDDSEVRYTYGGEFAEAADPAWKLNVKFFSDWRDNGISNYLWENDGATVEFVLDHLPGVVGEHQQFTGRVQIKAPSVGGEVRTTERTEVELTVLGKPQKTSL